MAFLSLFTQRTASRWPFPTSVYEASSRPQDLPADRRVHSKKMWLIMSFLFKRSIRCVRFSSKTYPGRNQRKGPRPSVNRKAKNVAMKRHKGKYQRRRCCVKLSSFIHRWVAMLRRKRARATALNIRHLFPQSRLVSFRQQSSATRGHRTVLPRRFCLPGR